MSGILNIGTRALLANQVALQTAGNNIANVNTPGYSRQSVVLQNVAGQSSGSGYVGNGVAVQTIQRNHSEFLTRQAALSSSVSAADSTRLTQLSQLESIFQGGSTGIGAGVSNMLNSFSDVAMAPTDLSARTVAKSSAEEMAARFRTAATSVSDLQQGGKSQLSEAVSAINTLAGRIAAANEQIARAQGNGQPPNDLLDQRDQLISQLNGYVQTTSIPASDGSLGIFLAGSQPLVLGTTVSKVSLAAGPFGDPSTTKLSMQRGSATVVLEEATLGGGQVAGLLKFQNTDLVDASNLLGRMALAIGTVTNEQHKQGVDLSGKAGVDLFTLGAPGPLATGLKASSNTGNASVTVSVQGSSFTTQPTADDYKISTTKTDSSTTQFKASNYEINFTGANAGSITRLSDGVSQTFSATTTLQMDGLQFDFNAGTAAAGDRFLITPFSNAAANINLNSAIKSPEQLAMAQKVLPDTSGTAALHGTLDSGNAEAMLALRDLIMFDGSSLTDGFSSAMSEIGARVQNATSTAAVSKSLAISIENDRTSVSGVNLDEEAAKLLQYQQSYQASAKMLQIAQGIFDTLLQTVSR